MTKGGLLSLIGLKAAERLFFSPLLCYNLRVVFPRCYLGSLRKKPRFLRTAIAIQGANGD